MTSLRNTLRVHRRERLSITSKAKLSPAFRGRCGGVGLVSREAARCLFKIFSAHSRRVLTCRKLARTAVST